MISNSSLAEYEIAFDEVSGDDKEVIKYSDLQLYFEVLTLTPTKAEIRFATEKVLEGKKKNIIRIKECTILKKADVLFL